MQVRTALAWECAVVSRLIGVDCDTLRAGPTAEWPGRQHAGCRGAASTVSRRGAAYGIPSLSVGVGRTN